MAPQYPTWDELKQACGMTWADIVRLTAGALLMALAFVLFWEVGEIAPGGAHGIVITLRHFIPVAPGILLLFVNIPLLLLGYRQLGRYRFLVRTSYVVLVNNISIDVFRFLMNGSDVTHDVMLCAIYGGILGGIANGLCMRSDGSVGGTVVISRIIQFRTGMPIAQAFMITDGVVIFVMGAVFGWENALYSLLSLFIFGLASDYTLEGPSIVRMVFIITEHPQDVSNAIQRKLWVGVTTWQGTGMYTGNEKSILFCTVNRSEVESVRWTAREVDPASFVVIGQGHQSRGGTLRAPPPSRRPRPASPSQ